MNQFAAWKTIAGFLVCIAWLAVVNPAPTAAGESVDPVGNSGKGAFTPGFGLGLGSAYATLGVSGSFGNDYLRAEIALGTEPFVWKTTYAAGGTVMFLNPNARVRPRLSLLVKSNASAVTVWEPLVEGQIPDDVEYEPYTGIAALVGVDIRLGADERGSVWLVLAAGYQTPFAGMDEVEKKADEFLAKYGMTEHEVALPRWEHFPLSIGVNFRL